VLEKKELLMRSVLQKRELTPRSVDSSVRLREKWSVNRITNSCVSSRCSWLLLPVSSTLRNPSRAISSMELAICLPILMRETRAL